MSRDARKESKYSGSPTFPTRPPPLLPPTTPPEDRGGGVIGLDGLLSALNACLELSELTPSEEEDDDDCGCLVILQGRVSIILD